MEKNHDPSTSPYYGQLSIFSRFRETKKKNEMLKTTTYLVFWKQTYTNQTRLLSALDPENGQFQLAFL